MTPQEKAFLLTIKYSQLLPAMKTNELHVKLVKECALVAVEELINNSSWYNGMHDQDFFDADKTYWESVKEEIEKL